MVEINGQDYTNNNISLTAHEMPKLVSTLPRKLPLVGLEAESAINLTAIGLLMAALGTSMEPSHVFSTALL